VAWPEADVALLCHVSIRSLVWPVVDNSRYERAVEDSGGPSSARGYEFEHFVLEILRRSPEFEFPITAVSPPYGPDGGFDMAAKRSGCMVLIEVKVTTPQTATRIQGAVAQLEAAADRYAEAHGGDRPELILAFPGVLAREKEAMALSARLTIWDGRYLDAEAHRLGIKAPLYLPTPLRASWDENTAHAHDLLAQLQVLAPGTDQWMSYENYCEELLNFLFVPPLKTAIPQSRDEQHINRRDFVLPNYVMDGTFWQFMRSHYEAHYIVVEVKNLTGGPGKREILQAANYLNPHGTGLFSIILARHAMNDTAKWICREQWVQHNKLIIGLDDDDVRQMLVTKMADGDPAELIRQKIEDFRLGI
jgi:hypothetical protein